MNFIIMITEYFLCMYVCMYVYIYIYIYVKCGFNGASRYYATLPTQMTAGTGCHVRGDASRS